MAPKSAMKRNSGGAGSPSARQPENRAEQRNAGIPGGKADDDTVVVRDLEAHPLEPEAQHAKLNRMQAEMAAIRDRYRDLYEFAPIGYLTLDAQWCIVDANKAARRLAGHIPIGKRIETLFVNTNRDDCYRLLKQRGPDHRSCELLLARNDGGETCVEVEVSQVLKSAGEPAGYRMTLTDITALKKAEQQLRDANASLENQVRERTNELAQRAAQLRALANQLTMAEQQERRKVGAILRDHLQQMLVAGKFLIAGVKDKKTSSMKAALLAVDAVLDQAIDSLRTLTVQISPPILEDADVPAALQWLARWMSENHGLAVDLSVEPNLPPVTAEMRYLLFEFVRELLSNTVKHAQVASANVEVHPIDGRELLVRVSDQGVGFDLERYGSGHVGKGLGLFGIQERLDYLGGNMKIESAPGKGSQFTITLPLERSPKKEQAPQPKPEQQPGPKPASRTAHIRVLLADDHAVMREGLANLLGQEPDIEIVGEAVNGEEVIEKARQLLPDIILMDLNMPKVNGLEATRILHSEIPGIAIIGLSMYDETERARAMLEAGAKQYVPKSGPSANLISIIRKTIKSPKRH